MNDLTYENMVLTPFLERRGITKDQWIYDTYDQYADIMSEEDFYYTKYSFITRHNVPTYNYWRNQIYERLSDSLSLQNDRIFINYISNIPGIIKCFANPKTSPWDLCIQYNDNFDKNNKVFTSFINIFNYYINYDDKDNCKLYIEANKPEKVNYTGKYLYHITNSIAWKKIQKIGLIPKSKEYIGNESLSHTQRIYLFDGSASIKQLIYLGECFKSVKGKDISDIVILKINNVNNIELYKDNKFDENISVIPYFTLEPIRTVFIEKIYG